jgi:hypothetical protein
LTKTIWLAGLGTGFTKLRMSAREHCCISVAAETAEAAWEGVDEPWDDPTNLCLETA